MYEARGRLASVSPAPLPDKEKRSGWAEKQVREDGRRLQNQVLRLSLSLSLPDLHIYLHLISCEER
jgi:hypothetical protein